MTSSAVVVPAWVDPSPAEVRDCLLMARRAHLESQADRLGGIHAALSWVAGDRPAPVTERTEAPAAELVRAEMWAAIGVARGLHPLTPEMWADLGAELRQVRTDNRLWADGASAALGWLIGVHQRPPFDLPRRPVPTAEQLYAEAVAARPHAAWEPEERLAARQKAETDAHRFRSLASYADGAAEAPPRLVG